MLLSEAIRLGAMLRPQGHGAYFRNEGGFVVRWNASEQLVSCVMGAAAEAAGCQVGAGVMDVFRRFWPFALECLPCLCPVCEVQTLSGITAMLVHLNDGHHWTREHIADWVATIEPAEKAEKIGETVENTELIVA